MWPFLPTLEGRGEYLYIKYNFSWFTGLPDVSIIVLDSSGVGSIKLEGCMEPLKEFAVCCDFSLLGVKRRTRNISEALFVSG